MLNFEEHSEQERLEWVRNQVLIPISSVPRSEIVSSTSAIRIPKSDILPDVTIEATGHPDAVVQAMRFTRDAGRVVIVGQYTDHGPVSNEVAFNPHHDLNKKHLDVRGCGAQIFHISTALRRLLTLSPFEHPQAGMRNSKFCLRGPYSNQNSLTTH